jgi:hypothetical protein
MTGHGWVHPSTARARCGGPAPCSACADEARALPLADLIERVNGLPSPKAMIEYLRTLGEHCGCLLAAVTAEQMPTAVALLIRAEQDGAERPSEPEPTGCPSPPVPAPETTTGRPIRDDSPGARPERLAAGEATLRLSAELVAAFPWAADPAVDLWQPVDGGPPLPNGIEPWFFESDARSRMTSGQHETFMDAWVRRGGTMARRSEYEATNAGRRVLIRATNGDSEDF